MPTITAGSSARAAYYDRNGAFKANDYTGAAIAPHTITSRWSYTVAAGKKASVQGAYAQVMRITVAAPVGVYEAIVIYLPNGGAQINILAASEIGNVADSGTKLALGGFLLMFAGDNLSGNTVDASTGGTVNYRLSHSSVEFDA